jgi:hypothetical protein
MLWLVLDEFNLSLSLTFQSLLVKIFQGRNMNKFSNIRVSEYPWVGG